MTVKLTKTEHEPVTHEMLAYKLDRLSDDVASVKYVLDNYADRTGSIEREMTRYKGFMGGALFIIGGLWLALTNFKITIDRLFGGD
jgi:hypothetical protein